MTNPDLSADTRPTLRSRLESLLRLWFGFHAPVDRPAYLWSGLFLLAVKYLGDAVLLRWISGEIADPIAYLSPLWSQRFPMTTGPTTLGLVALWSLPFIWIGTSMTARRARNAGISPLVAFLFFVPLINYILMLLLCLAPPRRRPRDAGGLPAGAGDGDGGEDSGEDAGFAGLLAGLLAGGLAGGLVLASAFLVFEARYALGLFLGAPFATGLTAAFVVNRDRPRTGAVTHGVAQLALLAALGMLLLFAIEGVLCLIMAYPLAGPMAFLGSALGRASARPRRLSTAHMVVVLLAAPLLAGLDRAAPEPPLREVVTAVEVDAPPEVVWPRVVAFSELPPPGELAFRLGIAYPMRARIDGHGVGAVRYCEFSTGPFVEPITRWEAPHRLSFDVVAQPPTMQEWSPWNIDPPHLTESLRSERGEFRLSALPGGRTRIEGSTWYRHDLFPQLYWNLWSDALIHRIHRRVLRHIAAESEGGGR